MLLGIIITLHHYCPLLRFYTNTGLLWRENFAINSLGHPTNRIAVFFIIHKRVDLGAAAATFSQSELHKCTQSGAIIPNILPEGGGSRTELEDVMTRTDNEDRRIPFHDIVAWNKPILYGYVCRN